MKEIKNNEDKALEIAKKNSQSYGFGLSCDSSIECFNSAMQMAEWKDDKFYIILACIKYSLEKAGLSVDNFIDEIKKQWEE